MLLALTSSATGQEIRPTLDKIKGTVIQLGYRETSRPFSFRGSDHSVRDSSGASRSYALPDHFIGMN